jgi:hypothetical protein
VAGAHIPKYHRSFSRIKKYAGVCSNGPAVWASRANSRALSAGAVTAKATAATASGVPSPSAGAVTAKATAATASGLPSPSAGAVTAKAAVLPRPDSPPFLLFVFGRARPLRGGPVAYCCLYLVWQRAWAV